MSNDYERMMQHFAEVDEYMAGAVRDARSGDRAVADRLRKDGYPKLADELEQTFGR